LEEKLKENITGVINIQVEKVTLLKQRKSEEATNSKGWKCKTKGGSFRFRL